MVLYFGFGFLAKYYHLPLEDRYQVIQMFYLSLGEQEIKIVIWGKVLLCSFFYIVNLNLYSFGPHPVGDYGCQMGQSFRVNHFEWELRVGRRPR